MSGKERAVLCEGVLRAAMALVRSREAPVLLQVYVCHVLCRLLLAGVLHSAHGELLNKIAAAETTLARTHAGGSVSRACAIALLQVSCTSSLRPHALVACRAHEAWGTGLLQLSLPPLPLTCSCRCLLQIRLSIPSINAPPVQVHVLNRCKSFIHMI